MPEAIKRTDGMPLGKYHEGLTESEFLQHFKEMAGKNKVRRRGQGCLRIGLLDTGLLNRARFRGRFQS